MDRSRVITILRAHEPELKAAGIAHLRLFGSVAREEQVPTSDIDLLADFDGTTKLSLLSLCHLQNHLTDLLGAPVDLIRANGLRPFAQQSVSRDAVPVF